MATIKALSGAAQRPSGRAQRDTDQHRAAGALVSARLSPTARWQIALAPAFNRGCSRARARERGGAARQQPGQHRHAPRVHGGRRSGWHFGVTSRFLTPPACGTGAAVIQASDPARGARTGR
jgi:hypothetical protein